MSLDCEVQKYYGIYLILLRKNGTLILTRDNRRCHAWEFI